MTIEERALASWNERYPEGSERYRDAQIDGYIAGATEQKAIDDKEKEEILNAYSNRIAGVEASRSRLLQRRESIITKAREKIIDTAKKTFCEVCGEYVVAQFGAECPLKHKECNKREYFYKLMIVETREE